MKKALNRIKSWDYWKLKDKHVAPRMANKFEGYPPLPENMNRFERFVFWFGIPDLLLTINAVAFLAWLAIRLFA